MSEIQYLTDANWQNTIGNDPALILFTTNDSLRGDFDTQFKKSAQSNSNIIFARVDATSNPELASQFNIKDKPVLVAFYCGETLVRRVRPWGTDVVLTLELINQHDKDNKKMENETNNTPVNTQDVPNDQPVHVTDNDFQEAVIDYSNEMPVLVDFWAEWCGPCRMVAPILDKLSKEFAGQIRVAKVDTDANPGLSQAFQIMSIPTIMIFKEGKLVFSQPGAFPEPAFRDLIQQVIALDVQAAIAEQEAKENGEQN